MTNLLKFQAPFERLKFTKDTPESALRKAIILQAITDAVSCGKDCRSAKNRREARKWILECDEYFQVICEEAGIEPEFVVRETKKIINYSEVKMGNNNSFNTKRKNSISGRFGDKIDELMDKAEQTYEKLLFAPKST